MSDDFEGAFPARPEDLEALARAQAAAADADVNPRPPMLTGPKRQHFLRASLCMASPLTVLSRYSPGEERDSIPAAGELQVARGIKSTGQITGVSAVASLYQWTASQVALSSSSKTGCLIQGSPRSESQAILKPKVFKSATNKLRLLLSLSLTTPTGGPREASCASAKRNLLEGHPIRNTYLNAIIKL